MPRLLRLRGGWSAIQQFEKREWHMAHSMRSPPCEKEKARPDPKPRVVGSRSQFELWRRRDFSGVELQKGVEIADFALPLHFHDAYQFDLVESGSRSFWTRDGPKLIGPGTITVIHPGETHSVACIGEKGSTFRTMHVSPAYLSAALQTICLRQRFPRFPFQIQSGDAALLFRQAHESLEVDGSAIAERALIRFLREIVCKFSNGLVWSLDNEVDPRFRVAQMFIESNLTRNISLADISREIGMSKFHFLRGFSGALGVSPREYIIRSRIVRAREMLASGMTVAEVAYHLGFNDQSHFGRHFVRTVGLTPSAYARCVRGGGD